MPDTKYDVIVVGAGLIGCGVAYHLASAGLRVAIVDKGPAAGEASSAAAGMLAPIGEEPPDLEHPLARLGLAALRYYDGLEKQLRQETGIDIGLVDAPTLRLALDEQGSARLQGILQNQRQYYPDLEWLDPGQARRLEPVLPETIRGALLSPSEKNVQAHQITLAYARGACQRGAQMFAGRSVDRLLFQGERISGVETAGGTLSAGAIVLAAGAWAAAWHKPVAQPPIFPLKGQMLAVEALPDSQLRHSVQVTGVGGIVPKADGSIVVGATVETVGFDKTVTADGVATLLAGLRTLTPGLMGARVLRTWAGLRPGSIDGLPLIGPSLTAPGLWVAGGHARDGILLGPLTGHLLADLILQRPLTLDFDAQAFDPDRFGGWGNAQ
jgi:glycine oxidase